MGWGWLCCAKKQGFVAGFPQILGFFRLLDLKKKPLQNFHFATAPYGGIVAVYHPPGQGDNRYRVSGRRVVGPY